LSLSYINLPIMLKYYVVDQKLSIEGGPQFGYAVKGELKTEISNTVNPAQNSTVTVDVLKEGTRISNGIPVSTKVIKNFDMGINLGVTYDFSDKVYAQLHYYFGLNDIDSRAQAPFPYNATNDFKNSVFQVSLGYKFM